MASTNETPRSMELGRLLRGYRVQAGMSQTELAQRLGRKHPHISRWEAGKLSLSESDLGALLGIYGIIGAERDGILELHRDAADPNWLARGVGRQIAVVREYENGATSITNVQPSIVPGPLQTRAYALEVLLGAGATHGQAQDWADFRMARREKILSGGTEFTAIIGEYALRYPACSREVAVEQARQLHKIAELDHITIQILPIGLRYTPARAGAFVLIESAHSKPVVHLEQYGSSTTLTDARYVRSYLDAADILRRDAMSPADTTGLIAEITDEMEHTT